MGYDNEKYPLAHEKLLPCPFCGKPPKVISTRVVFRKEDDLKTVEIREPMSVTCEICLPGDDNNYWDISVEVWQKRAKMPKH